MKKIISLSLATLMIVLSFAGCSSKASSKEVLLEQAIEANASELNTGNIVAVKEKYCNKVLKFSGKVQNIEEDYIVVGQENGFGNVIDVYLSTDEMASVELNQYIVVVGKVTDKLNKTEHSFDGSDYEKNHFQMPKAYFVDDRIKVTGFLMREYGDSNSFWIEETDSKIRRHIEFADGVDVASFNNKVISVSAKCVSHEYIDAEILEAVTID